MVKEDGKRRGSTTWVNSRQVHCETDEEGGGEMKEVQHSWKENGYVNELHESSKDKIKRKDNLTHTSSEKEIFIRVRDLRHCEGVVEAPWNRNKRGKSFYRRYVNLSFMMDRRDAGDGGWW